MEIKAVEGTRKASATNSNWLVVLAGIWWARRDSNPRPSASEADTLSS